MAKLKTWYGDMHEDSVGATMYATWDYYFRSSLLNTLIKDDAVRLPLIGNYPFIDYVQRLIHTMVEDPENERFNLICSGAFPEYKGKK